ncbi:MAG: hypothetical protein COB09_18625 [Thalassobium sp.]|nr:MAG: hypothetical protein COB09_18625 [Thalassobium sp.]
MRNLEEISDYITSEMFKNPSCWFLVVVATEKQKTTLVDSLRHELKEMINPHATKVNTVITKHKGAIRVMLAGRPVSGHQAGRRAGQGFQGALIMYDVNIAHFDLYFPRLCPMTPCFILYPILDDKPSLQE